MDLYFSGLGFAIGGLASGGSCLRFLFVVGVGVNVWDAQFFITFQLNRFQFLDEPNDGDPKEGGDG